MIVNVIAPLVGFDGEEIIVQKEEGKPAVNMLLREIITTAILAAPQQGTQPDGAESFKNYQLASKVHRDDEVEFTAEEITRLKARIGEVFTANVSGAAWMLLDPPA